MSIEPPATIERIMRLNLRARAHPRIGVCTEAGVHLLATMWEAKAMIDSARTDGTTLRGEQQLPPHRLQDSGLQASAMLHGFVFPRVLYAQNRNAASTLRPHKRGEAILDSPEGQTSQRLAGMLA